MSNRRNRCSKISARLWIRSDFPPEITLNISDDRAPRIVQLSIEEAERLRNVVDAKLVEARKLELSIEGSARHAA